MALMRARFYDQDHGRFMMEDPMRILGGDLNLLTYARNNPCSNVDPAGTQVIIPVTGTVIVIRLLLTSGVTIARANQLLRPFSDQIRIWGETTVNILNGYFTPTFENFWQFVGTVASRWDDVTGLVEPLYLSLIHI